MSKKLILILTLALLVAGGGWWWRTHARPAPRAAASQYESDMMEALVRELLQDFGIRGAPVCFLTFGEGKTPPSGRFIARFADCRRPAVRSYTSSVEPPIGRHLEVATGQPGLIVQIFSLKEYVAGCYDADVGISNLPPGHQRIIYRIAKTTGQWVITKRITT
jgi:hypothetical protein